MGATAAMPLGNSEFITPKQAAAMININPKTLWRLYREGGPNCPPGRRINSRNWLISRRAFRRWAGIEEL